MDSPLIFLQGGAGVRRGGRGWGSDLLGKEGRWLPVSLRELLPVTMASLQQTSFF